MRKLLQGLCASCFVFSLCAWILPARAQTNFPTRPIRMYVPFPPGGGIDVTARIAADQLSKAPSLRANGSGPKWPAR
jgi:tripartite-type tricarboxylate transporter receptor subunit TctC